MSIKDSVYAVLVGRHAGRAVQSSSYQDLRTLLLTDQVIQQRVLARER